MVPARRIFSFLYEEQLFNWRSPPFRHAEPLIAFDISQHHVITISTAPIIIFAPGPARSDSDIQFLLGMHHVSTSIRIRDLRYDRNRMIIISVPKYGRPSNQSNTL